MLKADLFAGHSGAIFNPVAEVRAGEEISLKLSLRRILGGLINENNPGIFLHSLIFTKLALQSCRL